MGAQVSLAVEFTQIDCGACGGSYAINENYRAHQYRKGGYWHCPYCQCSWGYAKGENAQLREQLDAERQRKERALGSENEMRAERDKLTRKLKRVDCGVCPECKRTFPNLAQHMACKHKAEAA